MHCNQFILTLTFFFLQYGFLFQHGKKITKTYIIFFPHVSAVTGNILIMIITFGHYQLLLPSKSTFMTDSDSLYLGKIQIWQNLNQHYYFTSTKSVICQIDANCSPFHSLNMLPFHSRLEHLIKLIYCGLIWCFFFVFFLNITLNWHNLPPSLIFICVYCFRI